MAVSQKSVYSGRSNTVSLGSLADVEALLAKTLEAILVAAAFLVPLIVLSEHDFSAFTELPKVALMRSLAGTGLIVWLLAVAVRVANTTALGNSEHGSITLSVRKWALHRPIESAAAVVLLVTGISAILSVQPSVSILGAEWGRDGYDLYTTASYITLFFLAASSIRSPAQLFRLWAAIALSGLLAALVGIAQHFAISPLGISNTYQHQRVTGTVGNPLFFGSLLTVTLPMGTSLALTGATRAVGWIGGARIWWFALTLIVFVHIYAALLTASRGPWLGMAAALIVLIGLTIKSSGVRTGALLALSVTVGLLAAGWLVVGPGAQAVESFAVSQQQELFNERIDAAGADGSLAVGNAPARAPASASSVIEKRSKQGTIDLRLTIWETSGQVIRDRPTLPDSNNAPWSIRQLFGYGPDTFRFVFPVEAPGDILDVLTSASHNDPLNRLVEVGLAGLLAHALLLIAAIFTVWKLLTGASGKHMAIVAILAVGAGSAVAGRFVDQLSGVAQVSDTTVIWFVLALLASAYAITVKPKSSSDQSLVSGNRDLRVSVPRIPSAFTIAVLSVGIAFAGYFIWTYNINPVRSDLEFQQGVNLLSEDVDLALRHISTASDLNPGFEHYQHVKADILFALAERSADPTINADLLQEAYEAEATAFSINPTSRSANFELAYASWQLAQFGDRAKALETVETYERLAELAPQHPLVIERLDQLKLAVGSATAR